MGIASVTALFVGMVMAVQLASASSSEAGVHGAQSSACSRELAPTLTAVIVGGRPGSASPPRWDRMAVTEQIDIRALGADPVKKLVVPALARQHHRHAGACAFALVLGFCGAMAISLEPVRHPAGLLSPQPRSAR
jgi:phospholipid/cholesterol/gamma-HCH transport system permease protein